MNFNPGQITVAIAIAAIISPVIVAIVNDIFTYRLKKKEYEFNIKKINLEYQNAANKLNSERQEKLRRLISDFVSSANKCYQQIQTGDYNYLVKARQEFADASTSLFIVLSPNRQRQILNWLNISTTRDKQVWADLVKEINSEAPNLLEAINNKYEQHCCYDNV